MFQTVYPEFVRINDAVMRDTRRIAEIGLAASPLLSVAVLANAVAGGLVMASAGRQPMRISAEALAATARR